METSIYTIFSTAGHGVAMATFGHGWPWQGHSQRNLQSRHGPAVASHCPKLPWPCHGQKWPWPIDLEGWNKYKSPQLAMVWPWQLWAMAGHGGATATLEISIYHPPKSIGHGVAMATLGNGWPWRLWRSLNSTPPNPLAMATFGHGVAMATLGDGWPWRGHGDFGDL